MNLSRPNIILSACFAAGLLGMSGCDQLPGKPKESDRWQPPESIKDFKTLFGTNCSSCHGDEGSIGPTLSVLNPLYLSIVPKDVLRKIIADGIKQTGMPGFAKSSGGDLTDEQIDILLNNLTSKAANQTEDSGKNPPAANLPAYSAPLGDSTRGSEAYNQYCANCHGQAGQGGEKAGSIVNPDYLHLVSDQYLRSVIIAGRPELGMPNYQQFVKDHPISPEYIANIVAWLASQRHPSEGANAAASPTANGSSQ
ncbi:MAG TPA: c-type cytochrome [Chthoniobacterales bacterium]|nr:c-type cytochrome [Chthoniobacterales bacterium]